MRTIWKYPLAKRGWNSWRIGADAKIVLAAIDHTTKTPTLWIEHDRPEPPSYAIGAVTDTLTFRKEDYREFRIAVTDDDIEEGETHVGSMIDGIYVWHIYERATR